MKLSISFMPSDIPQFPEHYHFVFLLPSGIIPGMPEGLFSLYRDRLKCTTGDSQEWPGHGRALMPFRIAKIIRKEPIRKRKALHVRKEPSLRTKKALRTGVPLEYTVFRIRDPGLQSPARRSFRCRSWPWLRRAGPSARRGPGCPAPARGRRHGPARSSRSAR